MLRLLGSDKSPKFYKGAVLGDTPEIGFAQNVMETVDMLNAEIDC